MGAVGVGAECRRVRQVRLNRRQVLSATVSLALGCSNAAPRPGGTPTFWLHADAYRMAYRRWTRHASHYTHGGLALEVWATFMAPAFRQAWARRYAAVYQLPADRFQDLVRQELAAAERSHEFAVTVQAHRWSWRDLADDDAVWRMVLHTGARGRLEPTEIDELDQPDVAIESFFPDATEFSQTYQVRFDRPTSRQPWSGDDPLVLVFFGPLGQVHLRWQP
jgi:hypothetical protein